MLHLAGYGAQEEGLHVKGAIVIIHKVYFNDCDLDLVREIYESQTRSSFLYIMKQKKIRHSKRSNRPDDGMPRAQEKVATGEVTGSRSSRLVPRPFLLCACVREGRKGLVMSTPQRGSWNLIR